MNEKIRRNVKLIAQKGSVKGWFYIYIDFSGRREYLMSHRHGGGLFELLKESVRLNELERIIKKMILDTSLSGKRYMKGNGSPMFKYRKKLLRRLENSIRHLAIVTNEYIDEVKYAA